MNIIQFTKFILKILIFYLTPNESMLEKTRCNRKEDITGGNDPVASLYI